MELEAADGRTLEAAAVGRENWLFFPNDNGGKTSTIVASFILTCNRLNINPFTWLCDIFQRIRSHPSRRLDDLLTDNWKTAQTAVARYTPYGETERSDFISSPPATSTRLTKGGRGRGSTYPAPRTDPGVRRYRTKLLPRGLVPYGHSDQG